MVLFTKKEIAVMPLGNNSELIQLEYVKEFLFFNDNSKPLTAYDKAFKIRKIIHGGALYTYGGEQNLITARSLQPLLQSKF